MQIREAAPSFTVMAVSIAGATIGGCDPVINIGGANFPGWLLCAIVGIALAGLLRPLFVAVGIESYLGPGLLIYPCLVLLIGCLTWLIFFNRV
jgi:YtcA family